jgi:hypothetical protein
MSGLQERNRRKGAAVFHPQPLVLAYFLAPPGRLEHPAKGLLFLRHLHRVVRGSRLHGVVRGRPLVLVVR